ncbi:MAG: alpha/beta hydrolase [Ilumatobacteraceae bacterium]
MSSLTHSTVPSPYVALETVYLETIDGVKIEADVVRTDAEKVRATVVIGHPHPLYGGDRRNHVVQAMQRAALRMDCHSIAPDFRGVGMSGGEHDDGDSERLDLLAACDLADMMDPDGAIIMCGYSFGSVVAMNVTHPYIAGWIAMAPPIPMLANNPLCSRYSQPKILLAPEHDQFTQPDALITQASTWTSTTVHVMPQVDHSIAVGAEQFFASAIAEVLSGGQ